MLELLDGTSWVYNYEWIVWTYNLWLNKKAETATRKELLTALQTEHVGQNRVAMEYKEYLIREMVSRE